MNKGTVKWFNDQKGYGIITAEDGNDVFVHYSGIAGEGYKNLKEGEAVTYDTTVDDGGKIRAVNVQVVA